jgi:phenylalanyl-tRNA synthetase beta subunit
VRVEGVTVGQTPEWMAKRLEAVGQRSISNVVDITNFILQDIGQPMHAFDAHKVVGGITVRLARKGETMTTLDNKEVTLTGTETVIADDEGVLALAGVKGGTKAIVDEHTTAIIFESANFNATATRKTSDKHGIRTDSSKRYEQGITSSFAEEGMKEALALIKEVNKDVVIGKWIDVYPNKEVPYVVGVSLNEINHLLGTSYSKEQVEAVFNQLCFSYEEVIPYETIKKAVDTVLGKPYKHGASVRFDAPNMFDCSSLPAWLYSTSGIAIPRVSVDQYVYGEPVTDLQFGDLIFSNTHQGNIHFTTVNYMPGTEVKEGVDHIGMYMDAGKVLQATRSKGEVVIESIAENPMFKTIVGYRRVTSNLQEKRYVITVPAERLDIRIKEDVIEEVGRIIGYDTISSVLPKLPRKGLPHKRLYYETKIKNILFAHDFSEIYTYTFGNVGEASIVKGLASDKEKLRTNLSEGVKQALEMNLKNAPLLGLSTIKVFEFGNVFTQDSERRNLSIALDDGKKKTSFTEEIDLILVEIKKALQLENLEYTTVYAKPYVVEIDFDTLIASLPEPSENTPYEPLSQTSVNPSYQAVSPYPFIVRDIAVWTPASTTWEDIHALALQINDSRIIRIDCFDTFTKEIEGRGSQTSYAFRFVIQSHEKTLTDSEANEVAEKMYTLLKEKGYEIR